MATVNRFFQGDWPQGAYRMFQVAFVVDDLLAAARRWVEVFGVGPFHVLPRRPQRARYRGVSQTFDLQIAIAQAGPVQIELIQQFDGAPSMYREVFGQGDGGFHHFCTLTEDYDGTRAHYEALGYAVVHELEGPLRVAYYDTFADFGFYSEVAESNPQFVESLTRIAETCAAWDGRDPIRILTRDGYRTPDAPEARA